MSVLQAFQRMAKAFQSAPARSIAATLSSATVSGYSLPVLLKEAFNKALQELPGYEGSIEAVSAHLLRSEIHVHGIVLKKKVTREKSAPFLTIEKIAIGVRWKSVLAGGFVGSLRIEHPSVAVNLHHWTPDTSPPRNCERRKGPESAWQTQVKNTLPFKFESIIVNDGEVSLANLPGQGSADVIVENLSLALSNVTNSDKLSTSGMATALLTANVMSAGRLTSQADVYPFELSPLFSGNLELRHVPLLAFKGLLQHYLDIEVTQGQLAVVAEAKAAQGAIKGYAKLLVDNLQVQARPGIAARMKATVAKLIVKLLRNDAANRIATKINFEGWVTDTHFDLAAAVGNFIKNAFMTAFSARFDHGIHFGRKLNAEGEYEVTYGNNARTASWPRLLKQAFSGWMEHEAPRMAASLSYYTCFSLAPLLLLVIAVAGLAFGREAAQGQIIGQLRALVGEQSAQTIQSMLAAAQKPSKGIWAAIISVVTVLIGATGVLSELKTGLNRVMHAKETGGLGEIFKARAVYFGLILGVGFLMMVSLTVSALLSVVAKFLEGMLPLPGLVLHGVDLLLSVGVITLLFAMIFRYLPDRRMAWRPVWIGSFFTAVLFSAGKLGLGIYLGRGTVGSSYGAAGSILIVLLWVYYSALILYFGAEFMRAYADRGVPKLPTAKAAADAVGY